MRFRVAVPVVAALSTLFSAGPDPARCARGRVDAERGAPPAACARCHPAIHDEWAASRHAAAWIDPVYQSALRGLEHPERCHGCHVPEPVLARLGRPPRARTEDRVHGVDCGSCHDARGQIAGPFGAATAAHESSRDPAFTPAGSVHLCGSCHDLQIGPVLPLARDFRDAQLAARGKSCVGCHMPAIRRAVAVDPDTGVASGPVRRGRSHALRGPADPEFCADAFKLALEPDDERLELRVGNRAGHRVPGLTDRSFTLSVLQLDRRGTELSRDSVTLSAENPLLAAETRRFRFRRAEGAVRAELIGRHAHGSAPAVEFVRETHDF